jgi:ATP phosphoribosyltransferase regulatory subunit
MSGTYGYYTGIIFRGYTYGTGDAIVKGGRYDHLLEKFGKQSPSIGFALVIDELMKALSRQKIHVSLPRKNTLIIYDESKMPEAISLAKDFRDKCKNTELLKKQTDKSVDDYIAYGKEYYASNMIYLQANDQILMVNLVTDEQKIFNSEV